MTKPQYWFKHYKARRAVSNYPRYDLPHKGCAEERELTVTQIRENFDYFIEVRLSRLEFFKGWLKENFSIDLSFIGSSVVELENWLWDYGGGLLKEEPAMHGIYECNRPSWEGDRAGYNVAIDAAIYVGEFPISRRRHLHWTIRTYSLRRYGNFLESMFHRPLVGGFPMKTLAVNPIYQTFGTMLSGLEQSKIGIKRYRAPRSGIVYDCRSGIFLADVPAPKMGEVFIFGDYTNEPL